MSNAKLRTSTVDHGSDQEEEVDKQPVSRFNSSKVSQDSKTSQKLNYDDDILFNDDYGEKSEENSELENSNSNSLDKLLKTKKFDRSDLNKMSKSKSTSQDSEDSEEEKDTVQNLSGKKKPLVSPRKSNTSSAATVPTSTNVASKKKINAESDQDGDDDDDEF